VSPRNFQTALIPVSWFLVLLNVHLATAEFERPDYIYIRIIIIRDTSESRHWRPLQAPVALIYFVFTSFYGNEHVALVNVF
jgi:hypothetical protein